MKVLLIILSSVLTSQLLIGCYGVGTHPYSAVIQLQCPSDTVIHKLATLKATGGFGAKSTFLDGYHDENRQFYTFLLTSNKYNFCLHLDVIAHASGRANILLNGIEDFNQSSKWEAFERDLPAQKKQQVLAWFNKEIVSAVSCK